MSGEFSGMPFVAGSIRGIRAFDLDHLGRMRGKSYPQIWTPGENVAAHGGDQTSVGYKSDPGSVLTRSLRASLLFTGDPSSASSHAFDTCGSCGFYAYLEGADERFTGDVTAVVEGYGVVHVGTQGFRAEKARIVALSIPRSGDMTLLRWKFDRLSRWMARTHMDWFGLAGIPIFIAAVAGFCSSVGTPLWPLAFLAAVEILLGLWLGYSSFRAISYRYPSVSNVAPPNGGAVEMVRRNYPDVPIFRSRRKLLAAFPVESVERHTPTPDTDPDFWTRGI